MTTFDRNRASSLARPRIIVVATLLCGVVLVLLPRRVVAPIESLYSACLEPARLALGRTCAAGSSAVAHLSDAVHAAGEWRELNEQTRRLAERNQELETALALAQRHAPEQGSAAGAVPPPLLTAEAVQVQVLGKRACAVLVADEVIDLGRLAGAHRDALALVDTAIAVDQGANVQIVAGDLALAGRRVFGKVIEVGPQTSIVRRADAAGYRDVVRLVTIADGTYLPGPEGVLEGAGQGHGKVRWISAEKPIAPGALVCAAQQQGITTAPLVYGTVARANRLAGSPHWEIEVDLALPDDRQETLLVFRAQVNRARLAARDAAATPRPPVEFASRSEP